MAKEDIIAAIKYRILEEQKKHKELDWAEIAARKIYANLFSQDSVEENTNEMKENILGTVKDLCANFLYYDRKEDDELSAEDLEDAVKNGIVTIDEMVEEFRKHLKKHLT